MKQIRIIVMSAIIGVALLIVTLVAVQGSSQGRASLATPELRARENEPTDAQPPGAFDVVLLSEDFE